VAKKVFSVLGGRDCALRTDAGSLFHVLAAATVAKSGPLKDVVTAGSDLGGWSVTERRECIEYKPNWAALKDKIHR